jgi:peptidyl-prolyl cis-trans isomerase D
MLKTLRKNVKSLKPVLWIVIVTFVLSIFVIWGGGGFGGGSQDDLMATVGRERISADDYFQGLKQRLEAMEKQFGNLNADLIRQLNIPQQTLEQLIQQRLLLQLAANMGLKATDREVRERIVSYPVFQRDGRFVGFQDYKQILDYYRIPLAEFEDGLRKDVLISKVVRVLTAGVAVTEEEVWAGYRKQNETAKIEYLVSPKARVEIAEKPSEADLRARFEADPSAYRVSERRSGDYLFLATDDIKKEIEVKDAEIELYYKENTAQFERPESIRISRVFIPFGADDREAMTARAADVRRRALAGEEFAGLAKAHSKDDKAAEGGDWGLFEWRSLPAAEIEAAGRLEAGGVSEVVETDEGAAVLKVTEKQPAEVQALAEASGMIKSMLEDQKARAMAAERIQRLERTARREKSLDVAAQKEGLKVRSTGLLQRGDPLGDVDASGQVSEALFGLEVKGISAPIYSYQGMGLTQLLAVETDRPASFEEVRDRIEADLLDSLKEEQARARLNAVRAGLKDDWNSEASKSQLEYKYVETHKRDQYLSQIGERPEIDELVFGLPLKETSEPVEVEDGYAVFRVLERKEVTREEFEEVKAAEKETLLEQEKNTFLHSYLAKAREEKKVRINYQAYLRMTDDILSRFSRSQ